MAGFNVSVVKTKELFEPEVRVLTTGGKNKHAATFAVDANDKTAPLNEA